MATANSVVAFEESQVGNDGSTYNEWYWGNDNGWAWCDAFQQFAFASCGAQDLLCAVSAYCPTQLNAMRNAGLEIDGPQRGAIVFFDWDNDGEVDHIGLVRGADGSTFYTVEGNSGTPGAVRLVTHDTGWGYGCYFFMPAYNECTDRLDLTYAAHTAEDGWLPRVHALDDFAGVYGHSIDAIAIWANDGHSIDYQVHHIGGDWGTTVNSATADTDNYEAGYAGTFDCFIDLIRCYAHNDCGSGERAQYRFHELDGDWFDWQFDYETCDGQDGFAGIEGHMVDGFQIC